MNAIHLRPNGSSHGAASEPSAFRFSTDMFPERERLAAWREFCGQGFLKHDLEPLEDTIRSEMTFRALPGLRIVNANNTAMRFDRPARLIDNDDVMLGIVLSGRARLALRDREAIVQAGDAVMMGGGEGGSSVTPASFQCISLCMPMATLAATGRNVGDLLGRTIPAQTPALHLLTRYLGLLDDEQALATPELQHQIAMHIQDLVALTLNASRDAVEVAEGRGARAARLRAIKEDIVNGLRDGEVSVAATAAKHRVSQRYLQLLFEEDGTTFTDFVLAQRLARAHRMLSDPRHAKQRIAVLAYDAGFNDPSYFVRCFRRHYGMAPSELRASVRADAKSRLM